MSDATNEPGNCHWSLSVVIPVYNSVEILEKLATNLAAVLPNCATRYEVVLVNDGSIDDSWTVICGLAQKWPWIRGVNLMRNYGQENALLCGVRAASFEVVVTMDDDLQHPPEEIPKLLAQLKNGVDVVYGTPEREVHGLFRDTASVLTKLVLKNIMGAEVARKVSSFRAFRTQLRNAFAHYQNSFVSLDVLLTWGAREFAAAKVRHDARTIGRSQYTFSKLVRHALNLMTGFSVLPLQLASLLGFSFMLFGLGVLSYVIITYFVAGTDMPGFTFLASVISIFSGVQLFSLGIIGEYISRMHFRMMDRPSYVVREQLDEPLSQKAP
jgi:undecaprenyl-phosphate 4-deoxy-4-formamido-L-arabinose transferase